MLLHFTAHVNLKPGAADASVECVTLVLHLLAYLEKWPAEQPECENTKNSTRMTQL